MSDNEGLNGRRVLVVDDNQAFGRGLVEALRDAGAVALGPSPTDFHARCLLGRRRVDLVVLDTSLYGQVPEEFALSLRQRSIPMLMLAAADAAALPKSMQSLPLVAKPGTPLEGADIVQQYLSEQPMAQPAPGDTPGMHRRDDDPPLHRLARCVASTLGRAATA